MKRRTLIISIIISVALVCSAQVPQKFNYQAVVRNAQHAIIANQDVGFQLSILEGSANGSPVYVETHTVTTNAVGLANLFIGEGSTTSGEFKDILWGENPHYLKVEVDPSGGSSYEHLGTTQMISVPYSLYSGNISSPTRKFTVQEEVGHPVDSALFEVRNAEGQTVFAVYPEGTRVYVLDEEAKGKKGGFAVGGYSRKHKGITQEYMHVSPDSIRLYFDEEDTKGKKGGFAVGGYSRKFKGTTDQYFTLKPDSASFLLVSDNPDDIGNSALSVKTKSRVDDDGNDQAGLFNLNIGNYFIGHRAGSSITTGDQNCFIGYESGLFNTEGFQNVFLGLRSGQLNESGNNNVFIGVDAGLSNTTGDVNTAVGFEAGKGTTTGNYNTMYGYIAGLVNGAGDLNTYIGAHSAYQLKAGNSNTFLGAYTGSEVETGIHNVYVGMRAGSYVGSDFNTFVGAYAGADAQDNQGQNTFIGSDAGRNASGQMNTFIGQGSGLQNAGEQNTCVGSNSGREAGGMWNTFVGENSGWNSKGNANVFLGSGAGASCEFGSENIFLGQETGNNNDGNRNVFIGHNAGMNARGSEMLIVNSSDGDSTNSLIWGKFDQDLLRMNGRVGIGRNALEHALEVEGEAYKTASTDWATTSDARVKTHIRTIESGLDQILRLRPVTYRYTDEWREANPGIKDQEYYHYIAQEFAEVFPEAVHQGPESLEGDPENLLRMNSQPCTGCGHPRHPGVG